MRGYSEVEATSDIRAGELVAFIKKPIDTRELLSAIDHATGVRTNEAVRR
jgi:FixJ family two-component response regulator